MQAVTVYWTDARSDDEWQSFEDAAILKPSTVITRGWLVHEDEDCVRICRDWIEGEDMGGGYIAISQKDVIRVEKRHQGM